MKKENIKKVVLAYSGGLDTSIIIPWLKENYNNCEVIAVSGDVGQGTELDGLEEKAKATGASKLYVLDLKKDFVENYIFPTLKFGAKYEDYLLGTSFARPCIAKALADLVVLVQAVLQLRLQLIVGLVADAQHVHTVVLQLTAELPVVRREVRGDKNKILHNFASSFLEYPL